MICVISLGKKTTRRNIKVRKLWLLMTVYNTYFMFDIHRCTPNSTSMKLGAFFFINVSSIWFMFDIHFCLPNSTTMSLMQFLDKFWIYLKFNLKVIARKIQWLVSFLIFHPAVLIKEKLLPAMRSSAYWSHFRVVNVKDHFINWCWTLRTFSVQNKVRKPNHYTLLMVDTNLVMVDTNLVIYLV